MRQEEALLQGIGGLLLAVAIVERITSGKAQPWHGLGVLLIAAGRGLQATRELGWTS